MEPWMDFYKVMIWHASNLPAFLSSELTSPFSTRFLCQVTLEAYGMFMRY